METFLPDNVAYTEIGDYGRKFLKIDSDEIEEDAKYQCILVKRDDEYTKRLLEGTFNICAQFCQEAISKSKKDNTNLSKDDIDMQITYFLISLGRFLGYFINSTSWRDQELHDYDKMELRSRLEKLMQHLK